MRKPMAINSSSVARKAGVSQSTVSKVVNNNPNLTSETRRKVIEAAQQLGYPLFPRRGQHTIAVIANLANIHGYVSGMLAQLSAELIRNDLRFEIVPDTMLESINERCIDAAVAISSRRDLSEEWATRFMIPLVRINGKSDNLRRIYSVCHDGIPSIQKQVNRLWRLGHRKIGFFFFNTIEHELQNVARRRDGFIQALTEHGIENPEKYCLYDCMKLTVPRLAAILKRWRKDGVTAVFFSNSFGTGRMVSALQRADISIPRDLSVIGWELEGVSQYIMPSFSTFYPDPAQIVPLAVELLNTLLTEPRKAHDITLPYRWINRKSVAKKSN